MKHVVHNGKPPVMNDPAEQINSRILIIDDNPSIHQDFAKILAQEPSVSSGMTQVERILFGEDAPPVELPSFELQFAQQGTHGVALVQQSLAKGRPFALAFIDMRMPPGWDGLETIQHLWAADPDVQVVI